MIRKRLLIFLRYFWPAYQSGGPVRSLIGFCDHFKEEYDIHVVCLNHDKGSNTPYENLPTHEWVQTEHATIYYVADDQTNTSRWKRLITDINPDLIYLQSIYDPYFTQKLLRLRLFNQMNNIPVLLAPRGELFEGAIQTKPLIKRPYLKGFRYLFARSWLHLQASNEAEAERCRHYFPNLKERLHIAQDIQSFTPPETKNKVKLAGKLSLVYLARIAQNKNLLHIIEQLQHIKAGAVELHVYGPDEDVRYAGQCKQRADTLPGNISVTFHGSIKHEKVADTLQQHDVYVLPTKGENYGHGIVEAMACGLPVLISDQTCFTPKQHGAGQAIALGDQTGWQQALQYYIEMDDTTYQTQVENARAYAKTALDQTQQVTAHRHMLDQIFSTNM